MTTLHLGLIKDYPNPPENSGILIPSDFKEFITYKNEKYIPTFENADACLFADLPPMMKFFETPEGKALHRRDLPDFAWFIGQPIIATQSSKSKSKT
jgi:hypothetical protein